MRSPLYRRESTPMPMFGEMTYFIRALVLSPETEPLGNLKEITTCPLIFRKQRRRCGAQTHSLLRDGKSNFLSVGQSIPGAFFFLRTVCNCVFQPSLIVPKSQYSSFLFDPMISWKRRVELQVYKPLLESSSDSALLLSPKS